MRLSKSSSMPFSMLSLILGSALTLLTPIPALSVEMLSTGVGMVQGKTITSREVKIQNFLEAALYDKNPKDRMKPMALDSTAFAKAVQDTLLETAVALEAQNFNVIQVSAEEIVVAEKQAQKILKSNASWSALQVSHDELTRFVRRKIQGKKFIQFRAQSSVIPVTDQEAEKYFNENRLKFGNLPFENLKENVKSYLSRNQVDRRLKDWFEVLLSKYQVKNLISEI